MPAGQVDSSGSSGTAGCDERFKFLISDLPPPSAQGFIRWSRDKLSAISLWEGCVSVLEYMVVVYYILLWSDTLWDSVVAVLCDNTAAVSWLNKNRTGVQCEAAYTAVQFASILLSSLAIRVSANHVAGSLNTRADDLSRDLTLTAQDEIPPSAYSDRAQSFADLWRNLLERVLLQPSTVPDLLELRKVLCLQ
jgi:hypothetical protein